jgi:hypothetical protein
MKCFACGYRYKEMVDENFDDDYKEVSDGKESFIQLQNTIMNPNSYEEHTAKLYACPICGTVRMEKW